MSPLKAYEGQSGAKHLFFCRSRFYTRNLS